jgi:hypothetical protein
LGKLLLLFIAEFYGHLLDGSGDGSRNPPGASRLKASGSENRFCMISQKEIA